MIIWRGRFILETAAETWELLFFSAIFMVRHLIHDFFTYVGEG
jgi:hypothetical protein